MLKQNCGKYGHFEFKMPDLAEYLEMLGHCGFSAGDLEGAEGVNDLVLTAKMLKSAKMLVGDIKVKIGKKNLKTYEELLNARELMTHMLQFVGTIQQGGNVAKK